MRNKLLNIITGLPFKPAAVEYMQNTYGDIEEALLGLLPLTGNFILSGFTLDGTTRTAGILVVNNEIYYFAGNTDVTHVKVSATTTQDTYSDAIDRDYVTTSVLIKCGSGDAGAIAVGAFSTFPRLIDATTATSGFMNAADKTKIDRDLNKAPQTLTDGATITWNANNGLNARVTLGGDRGLSITNAQAGDFGTLVVTQDATGTRLLNLPLGSIMIYGGFTLSETALTSDILSFYYDGTNYFWTIGKGYA